MTRPRKNTVDYFPHYTFHGKTMFIIEQRYGNDGYAFWFKLLETLGATEGHFIDLNDSVSFEYLRSIIRREEGFVTEILNLLSKLDAIDSELWKSKIVWSQHFVDGISDVYTRSRHTKPPSRPDNYAPKPRVSDISTQNNEVSTQINPQSRVEESRVKNKKIFLSDSEEIRLSEMLFQYLRERNPNHKAPNIQTWAKHIDLMVRIDGRSVEEIEEIISWCQSDTFWQNNILSTSTLRKQYDQLYLKMTSNGNKSDDDHKYDYWDNAI